MQSRRVRRNRAIFLALVILALVTLTSYFGEASSGVIHTVQRGAMEMLAPLQEGASRAVKPGRDVVAWVDDSLGAKGELKRTKGELLDMRLELARAETAERENAELRALLKFDRSSAFPAGVRSVGARVIVRSPTLWYGRINIDKGSKAGIRVDQPVIAGDGLVGRITAVSSHAAQVTLITDSQSGVAGEVQPRNLFGVVRTRPGGRGTTPDLVLDFIAGRREIRRRDMVVTAGTVSSDADLASIFPPGIPIGRVSRVDVQERELYQRVHIKPFVDLRRISLVQVLVSQGRGV